MILPRDQVRRVLNGRKTEARRPTSLAELRLGRAYPVQPSPREPSVCSVTVERVAVEELGQITPKGAWREGFKTRDQFFSWFESRYGCADQDLLVYVIAFVVVRAEPRRLLHRQSSKGYTTQTTQALPGEPEAVPRSYQDELSRQAQEQSTRMASERAQERRERWSLAQRLQRLEGLRHVDHSGDMRVIRKRIEAMERKHGAAA